MKYSISKDDAGKITGYSMGSFTLITDDSIVESDRPMTDATHYFDISDQTLKEKQPFPALLNKSTIKADATEEAIISSIPKGSTCRHDGETYTVDDGIVSFTAEHVGEYVFKFECFPYLPATITVEATQ